MLQLMQSQPNKHTVITCVCVVFGAIPFDLRGNPRSKYRDNDGRTQRNPHYAN